jgi:dihydrofolate reductase
MSQISLIAAVDECLGLGKENQLLCHLPADLKHFREVTMGKPVIMGLKTFISIGRVLPGRLNVVLSTKNPEIIGATVVDSISKALVFTETSPEVMVIGGAQVFSEVLPLASRVYLTLIHGVFDADVFFPVLKSEEWSCDEELFIKRDDRNAYDLTFYRYERVSR